MAKKKYKSPAEQIQEQYGKLPPQDIEVEKDVLGGLMLERGKDVTVMDLLKVESFYDEKHQKIFKAISDLSTKHDPIDYHTVINQLRKNGDLEEVGGELAVVGLTDRVGSAAHIDYHSKIIAERYIKRELIRVGSEIQGKAFDETEDVSDLLEFSQQSVFEVSLGSVKKQSERIDTVMERAFERIEQASNREDGLSGVPSGFVSIDRITSGWQPSDLIIIAARPSMGKTAFVLSVARNMAVEHKQAVALFSLEMDSVQLVNRLIASETELGSEKIRNGQLAGHEWTQLEVKTKALAESPIFIDDTPGISLFELRSKCRKLKAKEDISMVIVDYLQLMNGPSEYSGQREQEVSMISRGLKAIAKELELPVLALSQLNRSVETRSGDKRPQLSDLRESGAIEQDADIVMFIHRPEKMGITEDAEGNSTKGLAELIIAKHRNGAVADVQLYFREEFARFEENPGQLAATLPSSMNNENSDLEGDEPPF